MSRRLLLWLSAAGLALFVLLLALEVSGAGVPRLDRYVLLKASAHRSASLVTACRYLTDVLSPPIDAAVLGLGAFVFARRWRRWEPVLVAVIAGWAVASVVLVVKYATDRAGPGVDLLYQGSVGSHGRSFPSGHTAMVVVALGVLALLVAAERPEWTGRLLLTAAALSLLVAIALVYAGFHWLSDAVASLALAGAAVALVALRVPPGSQTSSRSSP